MLLSKFASGLFPQTRRLPLQVGSLIAKQPVRHGSKKVLYAFASRGNNNQFRKYAVRYTLAGAIPAGLIILYTTFVVGDAELYDYDPEQYQPEFHEFFAHPITRFLAKYCMEDPRISYYKDIYAAEFETHHKTMTQLTRGTNEIERFLGHKKWHSHEDIITNDDMMERLDKYVEEHEIGVKVKR